MGYDFRNDFVLFQQFDKDVIDFKIMPMEACIETQTQEILALGRKR